MIYCGDNKEKLKELIEKGIKVDLIYLDPPFFSNRNYEVIWKDGYEIRSFEDRWKGGINHYIDWMRERLKLCHLILKDTGSIYLHCDWHASHYLKVEMDKIFGYNNFQNEIIWCYKGGNSIKRYRRKHDTIFFYTKSDKYIFNVDEVRVPYNDKLLKSSYVDSDGKRYYKTGQKGSKGKVYMNPNGQLLYDYWIDINSATTSHGREYRGYPTQKPEALLERIIKASSNPGDTVLDPFCGCGTSLAVAQKLGRKWIGIDVSPTACQLVAKRLKAYGANISENDIIGLPRTEEELEKLDPFEFQNWVCREIGATMSSKKSGDMGIDGETMNNEAVQIKRSKHVGRNVVDNFETAMRRKNLKKGIIIAFSFGKGAYEEVARVKNDEIEIKLLTVKELLEDLKWDF